MKIDQSLRDVVGALSAPVSPPAYFEGWNRTHMCAVDDVLLFARHQARDLQRRSAESHLHKRFVAVVCLEAGGTVAVDGVPFSLTPGQLHLVFPHSYHHFSDLESSGILWLIITFETGEPERLAPLRQRTLDLKPKDLEDLHEMAELFGQAPRADRGDTLCLTLSRMLSNWCTRERGQGDGAPVMPMRKYAGLWQRFQVQLEEVPPEDLRVGPLAKRLSISERHLRQKFGEHFGVSIGAYLRNYRIRRSIGLLASSDLTQAEISDRCGYRSTASFHRAFVKYTGVSPAEFRK